MGKEQAGNISQIESFIKATQYILRLTPMQDIWEHTGDLIVEYFNAEWVAFVQCDQNNKIMVRSSTSSEFELLLNSCDVNIEKIIMDTIESGFIALEEIKLPETLKFVFVPITNFDQVNKIMIIAHKSIEPIPRELINVYLGFAGLVGTVNELRNYRIHLEKLVRKRTTEMEKALKKNELILHAVGDGIYGVDAEGRITFINPAAAQMVGWQSDELFGKNSHSIWHHTKCDNSPYPEEDCPLFWAAKDGKVYHRDDEIFWRKDGTSFPVEYIITPIVEGDPSAGAVVVFRDITQRKLVKEELEYLAYTDPMTGVSNRRTGFIILEKELDLVTKRSMHLSVCFLDVDGLKKVNDTFGHEEGDCLINLITSSIKSSIREIDVVSRMGGDEFLIIFPGCHESDVEKAIKRINDKLEACDKKGLKPYKHSFSYGILEITADSKLSANDVIKVADEKMYQNKMLKKTINK